MKSYQKKYNKNHPPKRSANQDRYLITYADLLTLLFALFIILYSMSKPDVEKAQEILKAMNTVFNPSQIIEQHRLLQDVPASSTTPVIIFPAKPTSTTEVQYEIEKALSSMTDNKLINFEKIEGGVKLTIPNKILFLSAKANLIDNSKTLLDSIATILAKIDMQIQVDGHTDATPIRSFTYASNWQLSAARAVNVVQALIDRGVPAYNMIARAYGEQRPVSENATEEGKEKNRRVELIITNKENNMATTGEDNKKNDSTKIKN